MPSKNPTVFVVQGTYPFPADMLRYDACWPVSTEDAVNLAETCRWDRRKNEDGSKRTRRVKLLTHALSAPTVGRWESFGWKVI